jgi:DNA polymerase-3 subunit epsilon
MKRSQISSLIALVALGALALGAAGGWLTAQFAMRAGNGVLFWAGLIAIVLLAAAALFTMHRFMRAFLIDVRRLTEAGRLVLGPNPDYRSAVTGHPDVKELASVFNQFTERFVQLQAERAVIAQQARADLEEERTLLATLMAELTEGVLVCNLDGQILLYNRSAHHLLDVEKQESVSSYVGLGRSVFGVIDRNTIVHALEQVQYRRQRQQNSAQPVVTSFVTTAANGRLLRAWLAPFSGRDSEMRGYVITMQDISEGIERSRRRDMLLQTLTERQRAAIGAIRAAIEAMVQFPDMTPVQRERFQQVIQDEAQALSEQLDHTMRAHASDLRAQWQLEEMTASDLLWAVQQRLTERLRVDVARLDVDESLVLKIDSYTLMQGVSQLVRMLAEKFGVTTISLSLSAIERYAAFDIGWPARAAVASEWQAWKEHALITNDGDGMITLREVAERHGGEVWFQLSGATDSAYFRLLLPRSVGQAANQTASQSERIAAVIQPTVESRPEYYDFDLFHQPGQRPELDVRPLRSLTYTVFDTETTGLTPGLDEIVSIGALRIVNGRLLRQEVFEQLIDPQRPIPSTATAIHGITDAMVCAQPTIDAVLPRFHAFAEDTVLVGHNLAFDMRMFQEKESVARVCFDNPILDTLLLSVVIHPEEERHGLEDIAARLGVQSLGRHTALGDAIVTGEIFLRMIPLLEERGFYTLQQARTAAEQTYFARLKY